jgi:hypothetical protein
MGYFGGDRGDGSFDYNCNGVEDPEYVPPAVCEWSAVISRCLFRIGYVGTPPVCGGEYTGWSACTQMGMTCVPTEGFGAMGCR